jgi:hypothetical protein
MKSRSVSRFLVSVCLAAMLGSFVYLVARPARAAERGPAPPSFQVGDVFVGVGTGKIKRFTPTGTLIQTLDTLTNCSEDLGMAFDSSGNLYATAAFGCGSGTVTKFDINGARVGPFGTGYSSSTESITLDAAQNVFVGQPDGTRAIMKFNSAGTFLTMYTPTFQSRGSDWIDMSSDQCTLYYTSEGSSIFRYNTCTTTQATNFCSSCGSTMYGIRIRPNGEVMAADGSTSNIHRFNSSGTQIQTYTDPLINSFPFSVNLDPDGTTFWTANYTSGQVVRFNIATGAKVIDWNAGKLGCCASGLAVFGEVVVGLPTPTPGTPVPTPTPTIPVQINPLASNPVPTLQVPGMAVLGLLLAALGILLMRRMR